MKIGLARHFKVKHPYPKSFLLRYPEVINWFEGYELADVELKPPLQHTVSWQRCYSSPLTRALHTANVLFKGHIQLTDELKELNIVSTLSSPRRLPFIAWGLWIRNKSMSSNPVTDAVRQKLSSFIDQVLAESNDDVLIVSHGFIMMLLQQELKKRGFHSKGFSSPKNGEIYIFKR